MTPEQIPYIVHEGMMARQERTIKRLWILCIINELMDTVQVLQPRLYDAVMRRIRES